MRVAGLENYLCASNFVMNRFKPQLVTLVNNDEEQFVVFWAVRKWLLQLQDLFYFEIRGIRDRWLRV
jgi:hypothetical protein